MKGFKKALTGITLVLAVLLMAAGTASAATTHTVCAVGCDYTTIGAAVGAASGGDTVYVYNGSYSENVDITTASLTLEGEGRDVVTVSAASASDHVFDVKADYVNISGFTITGATGSGKAGIYAYKFDHCRISDSNVTGNKYGIYLKGTGSSPLEHNTLTGNTANSNLDHGIYLRYVISTNLAGNTANENDDQGIRLYKCDCLSGSMNTLLNNTANGNGEHGIYVYFSEYHDLSGNIANKNGYDGIGLSGSDDNTIRGNKVIANTNEGVELTNSYRIVLSDNTICENNVDIQVDATSSTTTGSDDNVCNTTSGYTGDDGAPAGECTWTCERVLGTCYLNVGCSGTETEKVTCWQCIDELGGSWKNYAYDSPALPGHTVERMCTDYCYECNDGVNNNDGDENADWPSDAECLCSIDGSELNMGGDPCVPELATVTLVGIGLLALIGCVRRRDL